MTSPAASGSADDLAYAGNFIRPTGAALIAAASSARPGQTTLPLTSSRSGSSAGPSSAASSANTSEPRYWQLTIIELRDRLAGEGKLDNQLVDAFLARRTPGS